jgi:hypothetical protein
MGEAGADTSAAGRRRSRRAVRLVGLAAISSMAACVAPSAWSTSLVSSEARGAAGDGPTIQVRQVEEQPQPAGCSAPVDSLSYATRHTPTSFTLRITVATPLCVAKQAAAVVYRMPGDGVAWPQELVERRELVIGPAGVTEIVFERTCMPAQFDVVTGATPARIAPWAAWHGPLLFPGDTNTAFQDWGGSCEGPGATSTTVPPTQPPPTTTPSTTAPVAVPSTTAPSTTVPGSGPSETVPGGPGQVAPSSTVPAAVLGATTVPTEPPPGVDDTPIPVDSGGRPTQVAGLAITGTSIMVLVVSATVLVLVGFAVHVAPWLLARRRRV